MAKEDKDICCIANSYAIELLQLNIHADNIQDRSDNKTRFLVIGKMVEAAGEKNKTSIMININDKLIVNINHYRCFVLFSSCFNHFANN